MSEEFEKSESVQEEKENLDTSAEAQKSKLRYAEFDDRIEPIELPYIEKEETYADKRIKRDIKLRSLGGNECPPRFIPNVNRIVGKRVGEEKYAPQDVVDKIEIIFDMIKHGYIGKAKSRIAEMREIYDAGELYYAELLLELNALDDEDFARTNRLSSEQIDMLDCAIQKSVITGFDRRLIEACVEYFENVFAAKDAASIYKFLCEFDFDGKDGLAAMLFGKIATYINLATPENEVFELLDIYLKPLADEEYTVAIGRIVKLLIGKGLFECAEKYNNLVLECSPNDGDANLDGILILSKSSSLDEFWDKMFENDYSEHLAHYIATLEKTKVLMTVGRIFGEVMQKLPSVCGTNLQKYVELVFSYDLSQSAKKEYRTALMAKIIENADGKEAYANMGELLLSLYGDDELAEYLDACVKLSLAHLRSHSFFSAVKFANIALEISPQNTQMLNIMLFASLEPEISDGHAVSGKLREFSFEIFEGLLTNTPPAERMRLIDQYATLCIDTVRYGEFPPSAPSKVFERLVRYYDAGAQFQILKVLSDMVEAEQRRGNFAFAEKFLKNILTISVSPRMLWKYMLCRRKCRNDDDAILSLKPLVEDKYFDDSIDLAKKDDKEFYEHILEVCDSQTRRLNATRLKRRLTVALSTVLSVLVLFAVIAGATVGGIHLNYYKQLKQMISGYDGASVSQPIEEQFAKLPKGYRGKAECVSNYYLKQAKYMANHYAYGVSDDKLFKDTLSMVLDKNPEKMKVQNLYNYNKMSHLINSYSGEPIEELEEIFDLVPDDFLSAIELKEGYYYTHLKYMVDNYDSSNLNNISKALSVCDDSYRDVAEIRAEFEILEGYELGQILDAEQYYYTAECARRTFFEFQKFKHFDVSDYIEKTKMSLLCFGVNWVCIDGPQDKEYYYFWTRDAARDDTLTIECELPRSLDDDLAYYYSVPIDNKDELKIVLSVYVEKINEETGVKENVAERFDFIRIFDLTYDEERQVYGLKIYTYETNETYSFEYDILHPVDPPIDND